ncbi:unnamed protein product [Protopolystoma xenopodis]|uniref:Uncharacterized protein n=1 Tax=Protopolystoma xenopodis TaxID=117903 RepID=A0A3S5BA17_9PLAT|nr:unnamed protein product [Protopolystoma xenopodis]
MHAYRYIRCWACVCVMGKHLHGRTTGPIKLAAASDTFPIDLIAAMQESVDKIKRGAAHKAARHHTNYVITHLLPSPLGPGPTGPAIRSVGWGLCACETCMWAECALAKSQSDCSHSLLSHNARTP